MDRSAEYVLAVPTEKLRPCLTGRGLLRDSAGGSWHHPGKPRLSPPPGGGGGRSYRQIIPYVALLRETRSSPPAAPGRHGDTAPRPDLLGVGGHINPTPTATATMCFCGACAGRSARRWKSPAASTAPRCALRVSSTTTQLGELVHLGLFYTLPSPARWPCGRRKSSPAWLKRAQLPPWLRRWRPGRPSSSTRCDKGGLSWQQQEEQFLRMTTPPSSRCF